jgi:hypothetical protein
MSYTYLLESGEEYSAGCFSDIPQYVLLSLNLIAVESCSSGNEKAGFQDFQSGTMLPLLMESPGGEKLTLLQEDSLAKTSLQQEREKELQAKEAVFGKKCRESFVRFDPDTLSWKTHQCSLLEDWESFSETWPQWGIMQDGECWEPTIFLPHILESEFGLLVNCGGGGATIWPTPTACMSKGTNVNALTRKNGRSRERDRLDHAVLHMMVFPTPQASDHKDRGHVGSLSIQRRLEKGKQINLSMTVSKKHGALNPEWVEWLMAFPIGWTDSKPLETPRFQSWRQQHSKS